MKKTKKPFTFSLSLLIASALTLGACQVASVANPATQQPMTSPLAETITQYDWTLTQANDPSGSTIKTLVDNPKPVVLNFIEQGNKVSFSLGCNSFGAAYQLNGSALTLGNAMSTRKFCEGLNSAETQLAQLMAHSSQLQVKAQDNTATLTQTLDDGAVLIWRGKVKDSVAYGEAETIFLEIHPDWAHCQSGINQQCLQVRDVYYDDNWIKTGTSEWRLMKQPIKGYQHDPNYKKLLRVKKYVTQPADVKGKQLVYVLDMVVSSAVNQ